MSKTHYIHIRTDIIEPATPIAGHVCTEIGGWTAEAPYVGPLWTMRCDTCSRLIVDIFGHVEGLELEANGHGL